MLVSHDKHILKAFQMAIHNKLQHCQKYSRILYLYRYLTFFFYNSAQVISLNIGGGQSHSVTKVISDCKFVFNKCPYLILGTVF